MADRAGIVNRIQAILVAATKIDGSTAMFLQVFPGEPLGLPVGGPYVAFWYLGDSPPPEGLQTIGNVMLHERFQVMAFWPRQVERGTMETLENEIWDANRRLKADFRGDSQLNALVTDLDITDSVVGFGGFPLDGRAAIYRTLEFELQIRDLEGESIAP